MMRRVTALAVAARLLLGTAAAQAPAPSPPSDLEAGIRQVAEGEYSVAVITLDRAARGLAGQPRRTRELAQAYLYLGIAYVGLGSETSAKAKFRDALAQSHDISLSPEQFPPKVIELFEKARDETRQAPTSAEAGSAPPGARASGPEKGGSKLPLILIGVAGATAAGVAVAAGGGDGGSTSGASASTPDTTDTINASLSGNCGSDTQNHRFVPARAGTLEALLSWTDRDHPIVVYVGDSSNEQTTRVLARSTPASNTSARLSMAVENRPYWAFVEQSGGGPCVAYTLTLTYPH